MGRDNTPRERQKLQLARKRQGKRKGHDRILIVSEGEKTEPNYFNEIRRFYRISSANIAVAHSKDGTDPLNIVKYAEKLFMEGDPHKRIERKSFEKVFTVFDRDDHDNYNHALHKATELNGKLKNEHKQSVIFQAIVSVPCFEIWLLLHFEDIQSPMHRTEVIKRLKEHIPNYEKGSQDIFHRCKANLPIAANRAKKLAEKYTPHNGKDPYTGIAELIELLIPKEE